jgi:S1-C subfamily serine protease
MQDYSGYGQPPSGSTAPMPPMPPRPPRRRAGLLSYVLVALAAGALGAGMVVGLYHPASSNTAAPQPSSSFAAPRPSTAIPQPSSSGSASSGAGSSASEQAIISKVEPGLVLINTTLQYNSEAAAATGMVLTSSGLVLTNNHVIEDSTAISATTATGKQYKAKVVGYDETGDIALIQLQGASGLHTVPVGQSSTVKTGAAVVAMGNAEGQNAIVPAAGQVTGLNQSITASDEGGSVASETLRGMIETNSDIVSGDSGGPLADAAGDVIGMDTAGDNGGFSIRQQTAAGYAIPIDTALTVARQIEAGQASSTITIGYPPFLGVYIGQSTDSSSPQSQAEQQGSGSGSGFGGNGFGANGGGNGNGSSHANQGCYTSDANLTAPQNIANVSSGTLVLGTICDGPAAAVGMTAGSVITAVDGQAVGAPASLTSVVAKYHPGDTIQVTWVSPSGKRSTSSLKLTSGPPV